MGKGNRGIGPGSNAGGDGVSHSERDELLTTEGQPTKRRKRKRFKWLKRSALALLVLVLLVGVTGYFFGPTIAAKYAPQIIASQSRKQIEGAIEVDKVALSWTGHQSAQSIKLLDPEGNTVATLDADTDAGLIDLARNTADLGQLEFKGNIDIVRNEDGTTNLARALKPKDKPKPATGSSSSANNNASSSSIADLIAHANLVGVTVTYRDAPNADPLKATIDGVASLDRGSVNIDLTGVSNLPDAEPIKLKLTGADVFDALGKLQLARSEIDASLQFATGDDGFIDLMRKLQPNKDWAAAIAGAPADPAGPEEAKGLRADLKFVVKDGVIGVNPKSPAFIRGRIAPSIIRAMLGQDSGLDIKNAVTATFAVTQLNIPLPDFAGASAAQSLMPDMRGAIIDGYLETTAATGTMNIAGNTEPIRVEPLKLTFGSKDFAKGIGALGSTTWQIAGNNAGSLALDARMTGVLDREDKWKVGVTQPNGKKGEPDDLRVELIANAVPTSVLDAMIESDIIDLNDLGPTADAQIVVALEPNATASSAEGRGQVIKLVANAANARIEGDAIFINDRIASRADGVRFQIDRAAPTIQRVLAERAGISGSGTVLGHIQSFELPLKGGDKGQIDWPLASAKAELRAGDVFIAMPGEPSPIEANDLHTTLLLSRGGNARVDLNYKLAHNGRAFGPQGAITAKDLFSTNPAGEIFDFKNAVFSGQIDAKAIPTALIATTMNEGDAQILREALGGTADLLILASDASAAAKGEMATIEIASASGSTLSTKLAAAEQRWTVGPTEGKLVITPNMFRAAEQQYDITRKLYDALGRTDAPSRTLSIDSVFAADMTAQPLAILADSSGMPVFKQDADGKQSLQFVGSQQAMLTVRNAINLSGIPNPVNDANGSPGQPMALQIRDLQAAFSTHPNSPRDNEKSLRATIYDTNNTARPIASIDAAIRGNEIPVELRVEDADTIALERIIGRPGLLEGALGSPVSLSATLEAPRERQESYATVQIQAPRLQTSAFRLAQSADKQRMGIISPLNMTWNPTRAWLDRYVLGEAANAGRVKLDGDVSLPLTVSRLTLGPPDRLLDPAVFDVSAIAEIPRVALITSDGVRETVENLKLGITSGQTPGALGIKLTADNERRVQILTADLQMADLFSPEGKFATNQARVTGTIKGEMPTVLVDSALGQQGLLVDTLGPNTIADLALNNVSIDTTNGSINGNLRSDYATLEFAGPIANAVLTVQDTPRAELRVITQAASRRLFSAAFPFLNQFEKTTNDRPALVTATGLQIPINGDTSKLNGTLNIDLGTLKFKTAPALAPLLKAIKARQAGEIGQKIPPFTANITNGVIRYEEAILPIGDVTMRTYGKVNLNKRKVEIIMMVPFSSVSDDLAATVGRLPFVGDIAVVPIKVVGDMDSPRIEFDPELLVKNAIEKNPITSILDQLGGGGDKKDDKKNNKKK